MQSPTIPSVFTNPLPPPPFAKVPQPDEEGRRLRGRRVRAEHVPAGRAGHGVEGRARRPARLPAEPESDSEPVRLTVGSPLLLAGISAVRHGLRFYMMKKC